MISIITCSRTSELPKDLLWNLSSTIGTEFEIVTIDNSHNEYNIFKAYNEGVRLAKGDVLCFMHDDILFRSDGWGKAVYQAFQQKQCGLVGVVGCQFLSNKVQPWWELGHHLGCITQGYFEENEYKTFLDGTPLKARSKEGVAIDGLWFCVKRELFNKIRFDDKTFDSFHCYDVDTCMQVIYAGYQVRVIRDIRIEHKSGGTVADKYYEQMGKFIQKWRNHLPISRGLGWGNLGTKVYQWYRDIGNR